jgi:heptosyltransferase-3
LTQQLRARQYDIVINPGASDRASIITAFSGSACRLGRLNRKQTKWLWPLLHDQVLEYPWGSEPMYWQKLSVFAPFLDLSKKIQFGLDFRSVDISQLNLPPQYLHISPFASEDIRSLSPATVIGFVEQWHSRFPKVNVVVSCGPSEREIQRMALLQPQLERLRVSCLPGNLQLPQLGAVIQHASAHLGPDSGPLHLAVALGKPAVGCFLYKDASAEWMPSGNHCRTVGVTTRFSGGLYGLRDEDLLHAVTDVMAATTI